MGGIHFYVVSGEKKEEITPSPRPGFLLRLPRWWGLLESRTGGWEGWFGLVFQFQAPAPNVFGRFLDGLGVLLKEEQSPPPQGENSSAQSQKAWVQLGYAKNKGANFLEGNSPPKSLPYKVSCCYGNSCHSLLFILPRLSPFLFDIRVLKYQILK